MYQVLLFKSRRHLCKGSIERGNGGADTYPVGSTVIISCFCTFATQFVHDCRLEIEEYCRNEKCQSRLM